ncbi:MAG: fibronectin type III domain-containing protein [Verrucomicrobia bacterium]|nr:fibronectin type III domain-containing protein [Verrucomicrobiota bacterium]MBI3870749.1 fibronectin type III domain-containing protein [Verrucomicrobiota bacterium]
MSVCFTLRCLAMSAGLAGVLAPAVSAQSLTPDGTEYPIVGSYLGDQVFPSVSYNGSKGFLVWEDNHVDGHGISVVSRQLSSGFSADVSPAFRVNTSLDGNQERPRVALLGGGNVIFAWQGGKLSKQKVYARFLNPKGAFYGSEVQISQDGIESRDSSVAALANGAAVVVWSALGGDGDLSGVFLRTVGGSGTPMGEIAQVNQFTSHNQRNPEVAVLQDGRFVVAWISEQQRSVATADRPFASCDVYARVFDSTGAPLGNEFRVSTEDRICANPTLTATANGGFAFAWTQRAVVRSNGWDVVAAWYGSGGATAVGPILVNTTTAGDQMLPSIAALGDRQMVSWISSAFGSTRSAVFAQVFRDGARVGAETRVNTWTPGKQNQPVVASDTLTRFAVIWSTFVGARSYDLHAQRYSISGTLSQPDAPYVGSLSQDSLQATWAPVLGYPLAGYELSLDGKPGVPVSLTAYTQKGLQPATVHEFRVRYLLQNGDVSPWSKSASGRTWGEDNNFDGLPDDWQEAFWGPDSSQWPSASADSDGDGASNAREFFAGTDPTDAKSILRQKLSHSGPGLQLEWNTIPGLVYQVQRSENVVPLVWVNLGDPRLARSSSDSLLIPKEGRGALYRVVRIR